MRIDVRIGFQTEASLVRDGDMKPYMENILVLPGFSRPPRNAGPRNAIDMVGLVDLDVYTPCGSILNREGELSFVMDDIAVDKDMVPFPGGYLYPSLPGGTSVGDFESHRVPRPDKPGDLHRFFELSSRGKQGILELNLIEEIRGDSYLTEYGRGDTKGDNPLVLCKPDGYEESDRKVMMSFPGDDDSGFTISRIDLDIHAVQRRLLVTDGLERERKD